jgi:hypothetical protein
MQRGLPVFYPVSSKIQSLLSAGDCTLKAHQAEVQGWVGLAPLVDIYRSCFLTRHVTATVIPSSSWIPPDWQEPLRSTLGRHFH